MAEVTRDVKLIAEIRKHHRMIKDAYRYYSIDEHFGKLPSDVVQYFHECGIADDMLLKNAEEIINE